MGQKAHQEKPKIKDTTECHVSWTRLGLRMEELVMTCSHPEGTAKLTESGDPLRPTGPWPGPKH